MIKEKYDKLEDKNDRIAYLRAIAIGSLVREAQRVFIENEKKILDGKFKKSLLEESRFSVDIKNIIGHSVKNIYNSAQVLEKEIAGYKLLWKLLDMYFTATMNYYKKQETSYDRLILNTIPKKYLSKEKTVYELIMGVVCYLASFTDTKIVENNFISRNI